MAYRNDCMLEPGHRKPLVRTRKLVAEAMLGFAVVTMAGEVAKPDDILDHLAEELGVEMELQEDVGQAAMRALTRLLDRPIGDFVQNHDYVGSRSVLGPIGLGIESDHLAGLAQEYFSGGAANAQAFPDYSGRMGPASSSSPAQSQLGASLDPIGEATVNELAPIDPGLFGKIGASLLAESSDRPESEYDPVN